MGAIAAEAKENNFWARMQAENQRPPDSKARVRFLLDEIALLQTRFDNKDHGTKHKVLQGAKILPLGQNQAAKAPVTAEKSRLEGVVIETPTLGPLSKSSTVSDDEVSNSEQSVSSGAEDFVQMLQEKVHILLEDSMGFYESVEKELRLGKVERLELARLLQLEKSKLGTRKEELENLKKKLQHLEPNFVYNAVQNMFEKLNSLVAERENLHLKFEVQVELGHYFRLLKLLELQKAKDDSSRREIEKSMQDFRTQVDQLRKEQDLEMEVPQVRDGTSDFAKASDRENDLDGSAGEMGGKQELLATEESSGTQIRPLEEVNINVESDNVKLLRQEYAKCRKELKSEVSKMMAEQEKTWKSQQVILQEIERKVAVTELESHKLRDKLKERNDLQHQIDNVSWSANLPQGYCSIYFSPIFQERKYSVKQDGKDGEITRLKGEIRTLKSQLISLKEASTFLEGHSLQDRVQVPSEEKAISIDETSSQDELNKLPSLFGYLQSGFSKYESQVSNCILNEGDKQFLRKTSEKLLSIFQQYQDELDSINVEDNAGRAKEIFKSMALQICHLSEDFQIQHQEENVKSKDFIAELQDEIATLKTNMDRAAEEYSQELDRKEKTLGYAQDLNLRLANDMSTVENALTELRMEHAGLKGSLEAKLNEAKSEAEEVANAFRKELSALEQTIKEKEQLIQDFKERAEACQHETDAAVLEKNSVLRRLQSVTEQLDNQNFEISRLQNANKELQLELTQNRGDDQEITHLKAEMAAAKEELQKSREEHESVIKSCSELQSRLVETQYELAQREAALERLTLHLAASAVEETRKQQLDGSTESLRSKYWKKQRAKKSIQEVEEKMEEWHSTSIHSRLAALTMPSIFPTMLMSPCSRTSLHESLSLNSTAFAPEYGTFASTLGGFKYWLCQANSMLFSGRISTL